MTRQGLGSYLHYIALKPTILPQNSDTLSPKDQNAQRQIPWSDSWAKLQALVTLALEFGGCCLGNGSEKVSKFRRLQCSFKWIFFRSNSNALPTSWLRINGWFKWLSTQIKSTLRKRRFGLPHPTSMAQNGRWPNPSDCQIMSNVFEVHVTVQATNGTSRPV